ncbi:MAG TPA: Gfo/Idh/MocA family oxidoreductase [Chloroflexota bacterium]|nr:Gfo/Idh/MocA family oxidoreductase [Chloroflexota bacterium]
MPPTLGVGIYGAGNVSHEHIRAYQKNPATEVVAICSRTLEGASARASEFDLAARIYDDYDVMLADPGVEVVSICTPHHLHAAGAIKAARAGKHILVEKPIGLNLQQLIAMRDAVAQNRVKSVASFVLRWNPLVETMKALIADDSLGQLLMIQVDYWNFDRHGYREAYRGNRKELAGSAFLTGGCHAVDTARWLVGSEAVEVTAYSTSANPFSEFDPSIVAIVKFANGCVATLTTCLEAPIPYVFNLEILGHKGAIRNNTLFTHKLPGQTDFATIPTVIPGSADVATHPFQSEIDHFIRCIQQDVESHVNIADAVKTHEICLAADLSATEGCSVKLPLAGSG